MSTLPLISPPPVSCSEFFQTCCSHRLQHGVASFCDAADSPCGCGPGPGCRRTGTAPLGGTLGGLLPPQSDPSSLPELELDRGQLRIYTEGAGSPGLTSRAAVLRTPGLCLTSPLVGETLTSMSRRPRLAGCPAGPPLQHPGRLRLAS